MIGNEDDVVKRLLNELIGAPLQPFPSRGEKLAAPTAPGVYIIYDPTGSVAHVGRTPRGKDGLHQRLQDHLHNASSFSRKFLDGNGSKLREGYAFRSLVIRDARLRALVEAYATGSLCPAHLGLGQAS
jgi:hypothetical protein